MVAAAQPEENVLNPSLQAAAVVAAGPVRFGNDLPISIIAGPCQLESREHALEVASALKDIAGRLGIGLVYKTSFDKANRTSVSAARGIGLKQALPIFAEIRSSLGLPVLTDVHEAGQCAEVAEAVDVLRGLSGRIPTTVVTAVPGSPAAEAGIQPSVGAVGSSYDNALAETINGLHKTELIKPRKPWRTIEELELATAEWADWFNHRRLYQYCGDIPPVDLEAAYYAQHRRPAAG